MEASDSNVDDRLDVEEGTGGGVRELSRRFLPTVLLGYDTVAEISEGRGWSSVYILPGILEGHGYVLTQ
jgi:hypothetical protein